MENIKSKYKRVFDNNGTEYKILSSKEIHWKSYLNDLERYENDIKTLGLSYNKPSLPWFAEKIDIATGLPIGLCRGQYQV